MSGVKKVVGKTAGRVIEDHCEQLERAAIEAPTIKANLKQPGPMKGSIEVPFFTPEVIRSVFTETRHLKVFSIWIPKDHDQSSLYQR